MPKNKKDILKKFGLIALSVGLTLVTQGTTGSAMLMGVANGVIGDITSGLIQNAEYSKLTKLLKETHPSKLNHDLQKLISKSTIWAVRNINLLYAQHLTTDSQNNELQVFINKLISELKKKEEKVISQKDAIYYLLNESHLDSVDQNELESNTSQFPIILNELPFGPFFQKEFNINLQLCFGELLKEKENRPAYIAYQRTMYEKLDNGLASIIGQNKQILSRLERLDRTDIEHKNQVWDSYRIRIKNENLDELQPCFEDANNKLLNELHHTTKLIFKYTKEIKEELVEVKDLVRNINHNLDDRFISKHKVIIGLSFILLLSISSFLMYRSVNSPFQLAIQLIQDPKIILHSDYPKLENTAQLTIYLPDERKSFRADLDSDIHLSNLDSDIQNKYAKIQLDASYWTVSADSIILKDGRLTIPIIPNNNLSIIEGHVLTRDGQLVLENVTISMDALSTKTDSNGIFTLNIPIENQRKRYNIRISKEGYKTQELEYYSGSDIEIRLMKI